jgi:hypothetical protein
MRLLGSVVLRLVVLGVVSCRSQTVGHPPASVTQARDDASDITGRRPVVDSRFVGLSIESVPPRPRSGSRLSIRVTLRNVSDKWLWMNYGFGIAPPGGYGPLWLDVAELGTGRNLEWHCSDGNVVPDETARYILLGPDDEYSMTGRLECFLPAESARIRVVAHYQDRKQSAPPPPAHSHRFVGKLVSNALELGFPALEDFD